MIYFKEMRHINRMFCKICSPPKFARACSKSSQVNGKTDESPLRRLLDEASTYGEAETQAAEPEMRWATQPYAARASPSEPPRVQPRDTAVLLFPGQGSQYVGMGRRLMDIHSEDLVPYNLHKTN